MRMGRAKAELTLTDDNPHTLERWTRCPKTAQALARRARIVLACVSGQPNYTVVEEFKTTGQTASR